jgi:hypothetical protein
MLWAPGGSALAWTLSPVGIASWIGPESAGTLDSSLRLMGIASWTGLKSAATIHKRVCFQDTHSC